MAESALLPPATLAVSEDPLSMPAGRRKMQRKTPLHDASGREGAALDTGPMLEATLDAVWTPWCTWTLAASDDGASTRMEGRKRQWKTPLHEGAAGGVVVVVVVVGTRAGAGLSHVPCGT
jgi:hypothetical protein